MNKFRLRVQLSEDGETYEVWYTNNGTNYSLHKGGFKTLDEAVKETTIIYGHTRLLQDLLN
jgi:hypothetical protein